MRQWSHDPWTFWFQNVRFKYPTRISRAMSSERGSKRPRMHSDIEDANDMYNGVVEESVHVGGTSIHSDDEVGEGVACVDADELNVEELSLIHI